MPTARQVILFVVDGLRPDALQQVPTPQIDRLVAQGAYTWQAQTVFPSITLPCHTSLFYAVPPEVHGVYSNDWPPPPRSVPSITDVVHAASKGAAHFYTWEKLRELSRPGSLDLAYYRRVGRAEELAELAATAAAYLTAQRPAFTFVYLESPDVVGERYGWMSDPYLECISQVDQAVGIVVNAVRDAGDLSETGWIVVADHGGHDRGHGTDQPEDMTIPWIACGPGIRANHQITGAVSIVDTAPLIAHLLGLPGPDVWSGRVVMDALAT